MTESLEAGLAMQEYGFGLTLALIEKCRPMHHEAVVGWAAGAKPIVLGEGWERDLRHRKSPALCV
jgi:hypothetical protein